MWKKLQQEEELSVVSDQIGRATFAPDLAAVVLELLCHSGIYHFANKGETTRFEMTKMLMEKAKAFNVPFCCKNVRPVSFKNFSAFAKRPRYSVLSTYKIHHLLGAEPRSLESALDDYLSCAIKTF